MSLGIKTGEVLIVESTVGIVDGVMKFADCRYRRGRPTAVYITGQRGVVSIGVNRNGVIVPRLGKAKEKLLNGDKGFGACQFTCFMTAHAITDRDQTERFVDEKIVFVGAPRQSNISHSIRHTDTESVVAGGGKRLPIAQNYSS